MVCHDMTIDGKLPIGQVFLSQEWALREGSREVEAC